jgi:MFS family permease
MTNASLQCLAVTTWPLPDSSLLFSPCAEDRTAAIGMLIASFALGFIIGPLLGAFLDPQVALWLCLAFVTLSVLTLLIFQVCRGHSMCWAAACTMIPCIFEVEPAGTLLQVGMRRCGLHAVFEMHF